MAVPATDRIDVLYERTLKPRLDGLEPLRVTVRGYVIRAAAFVLVPFSLFIAGSVLGLSSRWDFALSVLSFAGVFIGVVIAATKYAIPAVTALTSYRLKFKREIVAEIFKVVAPSAVYDASQGIAQEDFDAAGLFSQRGSFKTDDRVRGTIGRTPFEAAEVRRSYSTGGKNRRSVVVFHGLFVQLDFNQPLRGTTIVQPASAAGHMVGPRDAVVKVALDNPAFAKQFTVYASDETGARAVLTPRMQDRIQALAARAGKPIFLAFKGSRAYIAVHYGRALFEPTIGSSTSLEAVREMAAHFALADVVVQELDLDTRTAFKPVDDSMLRRPDPPPEDALAAVLAKGDVSEADLWKAAVAAADMSTEDDGAPIRRPDATAIDVERSGADLVVRYPIGLAFLMAFAIWLACVVVALAALHALPAAVDVGLGPLGSLLASVPAMPKVQPYVDVQPLIWLIASSVVGSLFALGWMLRVRRVEIAPDAVRVWRGLRPLPRVYPRPLYGRIVRIEHSVHIGKADGVQLVNPTASPTISEEEARWVAAEMRRALRATGIG